MSAEGPLPPAVQTAPRRIAQLTLAFVVFLGMCTGACGPGPDDYLLHSKTAPDTHHAAAVRLVRCEGGWCEGLAIGSTLQALQPVATLRPVKERCSEIAWSQDGKRAGFVINGQQLRLYDADTLRPAGQFDLVAADSDPPTREARGVTFSENGAAITFDDCPRAKAGCRAGFIALR